MTTIVAGGGRALGSAIDDFLLEVGGPRVWNFPAPGEGHVDFAAVLKAFADVGFTGPYGVEIEFEGEPWPPLDEVNRAMASAYRHLSSLGLS